MKVCLRIYVILNDRFLAESEHFIQLMSHLLNREDKLLKLKSEQGSD
jgi:hypothetical protein